VTKLCEALDGLPVANVAHILMDGPSVNWSFLEKCEEHRQYEDVDKKLLNLVHVVPFRLANRPASEWQMNRLLTACTGYSRTHQHVKHNILT